MDYTSQDIIELLASGNKKISVIPKDEIKLLTYRGKDTMAIDGESIARGTKPVEMELRDVEILGVGNQPIPWLFVKGTNNGLSLDWFTNMHASQELTIEVTG